MNTTSTLLTILASGLTLVGLVGRGISKVLKLGRALLTELRTNTRATQDVASKLQKHLDEHTGNS